MTRPMRTIVILGAIGIAGVAGLALLADRYKKSLPTRSVHDLPAAAPANAVPPPAPPAGDAPPSPAPPPAVPAAASTARSAAPVSAASAATPGALKEVDAFIAARKDMKAVMDQRKGQMSRLKAEMAGDPSAIRTSPPRAYFDLFFEITLAQKHALGERGLDVDAYDRVLKDYQARKEGKPANDPAVAAALEARKDALAAADFGDYAFFDAVRGE